MFTIGNLSRYLTKVKLDYVTRYGETGSVLLTHLSLSLAIPVCFVVFAGIIKSVVKGILWSNFYLGIDLALASMSNLMLNIVELSRKMDGIDLTVPTGAGAVPAGSMLRTIQYQLDYSIAILVLGMASLLILMAMHKRFDGPVPENQGSHRHIRRGVWLGVIGNIVGGACLAVFIYARLKGKV